MWLEGSGGLVSLTEAEVAQLWTDWRAHADGSARGALVSHYLPLVDLVARASGRHLPPAYRPDLHSFGVIGLMDAVDKFRPELGHRFETYGYQRIRGAIGDGLRTLAWLPRGASKRASRIIENVVPVDFQTARTPVGARLQDSLHDRAELPADHELELRADHEEVLEAIDLLPERERFVVEQYYYEERPLAEIGAALGVTESRVSQLHRRALRMLEAMIVERLSA